MTITTIIVMVVVSTLKGGAMSDATDSLGLGLRFSRVDFWVLRILLLLAAVVVPAVNLAPRLATWAAGGSLSWTTREASEGRGVPEFTRGGTTAVYEGGIHWLIGSASTAQWVWSLIPALIGSVLLISGCVITWRLLSAVRAGEPFRRPAVRSMLIINLLVVAYGMLVPLITVAADFVITADLRAGGPAAYFTVVPADFAPIMIGLLLVAVTECFRQGVALRDDVDGLV